jgi:hypothetical protein
VQQCQKTHYQAAGQQHNLKDKQWHPVQPQQNGQSTGSDQKQVKQHLLQPQLRTMHGEPTQQETK